MLKKGYSPDLEDIRKITQNVEQQAEELIGEDYDEDSLTRKIEEFTGDDLIKQAMHGVAAKRITTSKGRERTGHLLEPYSDLLEPNPRSMKRLVNAYGLHKAVNLLAGHKVEREPLALWSILEMRWPLLTDYLADHPENVKEIGKKLHKKKYGRI